MKLHHLAFRTNDVEALASFYEDVFRFEIVRREPPRSIWLGLDGGAMLMIEQRTEKEPTVAPGSMELVAFRVDEATRAEIRARAVDHRCYDGETEFTVYLRDPDGRRVGVSTFTPEA